MLIGGYNSRIVSRCSDKLCCLSETEIILELLISALDESLRGSRYIWKSFFEILLTFQPIYLT